MCGGYLKNCRRLKTTKNWTPHTSRLNAHCWSPSGFVALVGLRRTLVILRTQYDYMSRNGSGIQVKHASFQGVLATTKLIDYFMSLLNVNSWHIGVFSHCRLSTFWTVWIGTWTATWVTCASASFWTIYCVYRWRLSVKVRTPAFHSDSYIKNFKWTSRKMLQSDWLMKW